MQYLLNNKVIYLPDKSLLLIREKKQTEPVAYELDVLENSVLSLLIDNNGNLVSKDRLLTLWSPKIVTDNALTRVIACIRAKLSCDAKNPSFIRTVPKQGYLFVGNIKQHTSAADASHRSAFLNFPRFTPLLTIVALMVIGTLTVAYTNNTHTLKFNAPVTIALAGNSYTKDQLRFWRNGISYAYSAIDQLYGNRFIVWTTNVSNGEIRETERDLESPVFVSDSELIYRRRDTDSLCEIVKLDITTMQKHIVTDCNVYSHAVGAAHISNEIVWFTDVTSMNMPGHVYSVDMHSGEKRQLPFRYEKGAGAYAIFGDHRGEQIAVLSSSDYRTTKIDIIDVQSLDILFTIHQPILLYSVALLDNHVVTKGANGGLEFWHRQTNLPEHTMAIPVFISQPVRQSGNSLTLSKGEMFLQSIERYSTISQSSQTIIKEPGSRVHSPSYAGGESLLYISNSTGISQIHRYETGVTQQLTSYTTIGNRSNMSFSSIYAHMAVQENSKTIIYDVKDHDLKIIGEIDGIKPKYIGYSLFVLKKHKNDKYILSEFASGNYTNVFSTHNYSEVSGHNDTLIFKKKSAPGLHTREGSTLKLPFALNAFSTWSVYNDSLYLQERSFSPVYAISLSDNQQLTHLDWKCADVNYIDALGCTYTGNEIGKNQFISIKYDTR